MGDLTRSSPKCLLDIEGRPLIEHTLDKLRRAGCRRIFVVTGYLHDRLATALLGHREVTCILNSDATNENILHSLMKARHVLHEPALITYSDTYLSWSVYEAMLAVDSNEAVVAGVDLDWQAVYEGRNAHPVEEAEKVHLTYAERPVRFGKHLPATSEGLLVGEFVGALRTNAIGSRLLVDTFTDIDSRVARDEAFQSSSRWRQAYLTDLLQECLDRGVSLAAAPCLRGWVELDTPEDYHRFSSLCRTQRLDLLPSHDHEH